MSKATMGYSPGEEVYVFNPKTKRFQKRVVKHNYGFFGQPEKVTFEKTDTPSLGSEPAHRVGKTKEIALANYYECAVEKLHYWQQLVDWFEKKKA